MMGGGTTRRGAMPLLLAIALLALSAPAYAGPAGNDRWALLIGVDEYQGRTRDNVGGKGDVALMRDLLQQRGWAGERIRTLTDEQATAAGIRAGLEWIAQRCQSPGSWCVVHYSGHTKQISTGAGGEGLHEYLWPSDNQFISDDEFASYMRRLNGFAWINIAACEAAGFDNGISSPRRLITAASGETEKAYESPGWGTSIWTGLLVREAIFEGRGDANGDGHVTLAEAFGHAAARAAHLTGRERTGPQHAQTSGGNLGDWFSAPAPDPVAAPVRNCLLNLICF